MEALGSAAFSRAVQARDLRTSAVVCLKVVKVGQAFCLFGVANGPETDS